MPECGKEADGLDPHALTPELHHFDHLQRDGLPLQELVGQLVVVDHHIGEDEAGLLGDGFRAVAKQEVEVADCFLLDQTLYLAFGGGETAEDLERGSEQ